MNARQELIAAWTAMGLTCKQMAHLLHCSDKTISYHLTKIHQRLGFHDSARLTHWALAHNLVQLNQTV